MKKEEWINSVMSSMDELERVSPSTDLFAKIEQEIKAKTVKIVPIQWIVGIAASFLVLITMNFFAIQNNSIGNYENSTSESLERLQTELDANNYLY